MANECPLCHHRVSDWMMAARKSTEIKGDIFHNSCLIDFELRYGHKYGESTDGLDTAAGWTVGVPVRHPEAS